MAHYGYIRVSTEGQTTENQRMRILEADLNVTEFFSEDGVSGSKKAFDRPAFARMMDKLTAGDTIVVTMIDRLGRSASDILNVVEELKQRKIKIKVMQFDGMDITSAMGKMILTCMAAMAELERNILIERTKAGMERTKEQGTKLGAPLTIAPEILKAMIEKQAAGASLAKLKEEYGFPRNTIHRNLNKWKDNFHEYEAEWADRQTQYQRAA